jgi:hypothetical protein
MNEIIVVFVVVVVVVCARRVEAQEQQSRYNGGNSLAYWPVRTCPDVCGFGLQGAPSILRTTGSFCGVHGDADMCKRERQERKGEGVNTSDMDVLCLQARMFNQDLCGQKEAAGEEMRREEVIKQGAVMNLGLREQ